LKSNAVPIGTLSAIATPELIHFLSLPETSLSGAFRGGRPRRSHVTQRAVSGMSGIVIQEIGWEYY